MDSFEKKDSQTLRESLNAVGNFAIQLARQLCRIYLSEEYRRDPDLAIELASEAFLLLRFKACRPENPTKFLQYAQRGMKHHLRRLIEERQIQPPSTHLIDNESAEGLTLTAFDQADMRLQIRRALATISEREAMMYTLRFVEKLTLEEVGQHIGVGRERVRQMEAAMLRQLRHPARSKFLYEFCEHWRPRQREELPPPTIWTPAGRAMIAALNYDPYTHWSSYDYLGSMTLEERYEHFLKQEQKKC